MNLKYLYLSEKNSVFKVNKLKVETELNIGRVYPMVSS